MIWSTLMDTLAFRRLTPMHRAVGMVALALMIGQLAEAQTSQPDARSLVRQAQIAMGIDDFVAGHGAVHWNGTSNQLGLDGEFELTIDHAGRFLRSSSSRLGQTFGFDGDTAWTINYCKTPGVLELGDREEALVEAWLLTGWWAAADAPFEFALAEPDGKADGGLLTFTLRDGVASGRIELDPETHLPRMIKYVAEANEQVMAFDDFASHDGLVVPSRVTVTDVTGMAVTYRIEEVGRIATAAPDTFAPRLVRIDDVAFDSDQPAALHVERAPSGHLMVRASIDGHDDLGWYFFDTGAGISCFSTPVAKEIDLDPLGTVLAVGVGGNSEAHFYQPKTLSVGPMTQRNPVLGGIDLSFIEQGMGIKVAGIIGYDFIARCVVEYDGAAGTISLHDSATYHLDKGDWETVHLYGGHPNVEAGFEGNRGIFKIDTGAVGTVTFHAPTVRKFKLLEGRETSSNASGGVGGMVDVMDGEIDYFTLGGKRFDNPAVAFALEDKGAFADPYVMGNLGSTFLHPFVMVLDYANRRIAFVEK